MHKQIRAVKTIIVESSKQTSRTFSSSSRAAQRLKHLPGIQETQVQSLGWEDPLEKEMATHSSILAWEIPWTEGTGYCPWGHKRVRHDLAAK